jgi:hypothetical protein
LYALKQPWIEDEATRFDYATGLPWEVQGANGAGDRDSTALGSLEGVLPGSYTIDLNQDGVSQVQQWINQSATNHGFAILDYTGPTDGMDFYARESDDIERRPMLIVTFRRPTDLSTHESVEYPEHPVSIQIESVYPNPFNPKAHINFTVQEVQRVSVDLYGIQGQQVRHLYDRMVPAQTQQHILIDGSGLASGTYLIRFEGRDFVEVIQAVLLK